MQIRKYKIYLDTGSNINGVCNTINNLFEEYFFLKHKEYYDFFNCKPTKKFNITLKIEQ